MGRPTKLEDVIQVPGDKPNTVREVVRRDAILELVRQGCTHRVAALRAGVSESTFYSWRDRGQKARSGKFRQFYEDLQTAEAQAEATLTLQMRVHGRTEWRAVAWMLERRFPSTWRAKQTVDATITTPAGQAPVGVIVGVASMDADQLAALSGCNLDDLDNLQLPTEVGLAPGGDTDTDTDDSQETPDHDGSDTDTDTDGSAAAPAAAPDTPARTQGPIPDR